MLALPAARNMLTKKNNVMIASFVRDISADDVSVGFWTGVDIVTGLYM